MILKFTSEALTKLQKETLSLSDVFGIFAILRLQLEKYPKNDLSLQLLTEIKPRESNILNNTPMFACMYLDPRFQCMLSAEQKTIAKDHLVKLYSRIAEKELNTENNNDRTLNMSELNISHSHSMNAYSIVDDSVDLLEDMLRSKCDSLPDNRSLQKIDISLSEFNYSGQNRIKSTDSVIEFWRNNEKSKPDMFKLAEVIFCIPPTEVSTERDFSAVNFILNKFRNSLDDESLERILIVKLNEDIFFNTTL